METALFWVGIAVGLCVFPVCLFKFLESVKRRDETQTMVFIIACSVVGGLIAVMLFACQQDYDIATVNIVVKG